MQGRRDLEFLTNVLYFDILYGSYRLAVSVGHLSLCLGTEYSITLYSTRLLLISAAVYSEYSGIDIRSFF